MTEPVFVHMTMTQKDQEWANKKYKLSDAPFGLIITSPDAFDEMMLAASVPSSDISADERIAIENIADRINAGLNGTLSEDEKLKRLQYEKEKWLAAETSKLQKLFSRNFGGTIEIVEKPNV